MVQQIESSSSLTVRAALEFLTVEQLKNYLALLPIKERPKRKMDMVVAIEQYVMGEKLRTLWEQLDDKQQLAVAETIYSSSGFFDAERFRAKYNELPVFGTKDSQWRYSETPSLLRLFLYGGPGYSRGAPILPVDLKQRLVEFVPQPTASELRKLDELPEYFELIEKDYQWQDNDEGITVIMGGKMYQMPREQPEVKTTTHQIPLIRRNTEREAVVDLPIMLRLVDKGKVSVSEKTFQPSAATTKTLAEALNCHDYYELTPKQNKWEQTIGPIKAFAWPLLLQGAKLAELHGKKLALTKTGRNALAKPAAETLRLLWQRWMKTKLFDEFSRIDTIKGQRGKGKRYLVSPAERRAVIHSALMQCPVGSWVQFDDFSRFMQATGCTFQVTRNSWSLYIVDSKYGSLGYEGYDDWPIVEGRYLLCLLFEYAATLGLIDVAYIEPEGARDDYASMWGADQLEFLSRYDGLMYFRLNPLGAYCLGLADDYQPQDVASKTTLSVLPSLQVNVVDKPLSTEEALLLETWAEKSSETVWRLDRDKALRAVESGREINELSEFLKVRDEQSLPETIESFIATAEQRAKALKITGTALLIECKDAAITEFIATHESTKKLCLRAGDLHLTVKVESETQFRKAVRRLGYGLPRV